MLIMMLNFSPDMLGLTTCAGSLDLMTLPKARNNVAILYNNNKKIIKKNKKKHKDKKDCHKIKAKKITNHTTLSKDIIFYSFRHL
jgi:hypothetical protein